MNDVIVKTKVPEELRNLFKSVCARNGKTQADVLREFIEQYSGWKTVRDKKQ